MIAIMVFIGIGVAIMAAGIIMNRHADHTEIPEGSVSFDAGGFLDS